jgi:hypothetical protein
MVLPPQYEAQNEAREREIPLAFNDIWDRSRYMLNVVPPPKRPQGWCGPIPRDGYEILENKGGKLVATLLANGTYELMDEVRRKEFDLLTARVDVAGKRAHDRWLEEYAKLKAEEPSR